MKSNINIQPLKVVNKLPNAFGNTINKYNELESEQHYNDGWREVVKPTISEYQKLGNLFFDEDNDVVTYEVIDFTQEQIQSIEDSKVVDNSEQQYYELLKTDWYFIRQAETGEAVPQSVLDERQAIRDKYDV